MKNIFLILTVLCSSLLVSCNKDDSGGKVPEGASFTLKNGSIVVKNNPDIKINALNTFPLGVSTETDFSASRKRSTLKSTAEDESGNDNLRGYDYRFKLVAEVNTLTIDGVEVQATHVKIEKISDVQYYAFVAYNEQGDGHRGGVVVYKVVATNGKSLEETTATVTPVASAEMPKAEVSALDYYNGKLYIAGASEDPNFGYDENKDGFNYAFYGVMELNADKTFKDAEPVIVKLTSFQGTSIRALNDRVYITTGDGANNTKGGLYIYNATDQTFINSILGKDHVRSVDVDGSNIFVMQAEPARITQYGLNGEGEKVIYSTTNESMQKNAKSEILAWKDYIFVAENESGLRMLDKNGNVNDELAAPGTDKEKHVTNSVVINSDVKKNIHGTDVSSNLLFLANGEKGIYWYDLMNVNKKDCIVLCNSNSTNFEEGTSANFIASRGNIVFVADGKGGLKILYIGFDEGDPPPPVPGGCDDVKQYFNNEPNSFLREMVNVFGASASANTKILFGDASKIHNDILVLEETDLYLTYISCTASLHNTVGFFVVPAASASMSNKDYFEAVVRTDFQKQSVSTNRYILDDKYVAMPNMKNSSLVAGNTYQIKNYNRADSKFEAGDRIVMFIVPDGWVSQNSRVEFNTNQYNRPVFLDKDLNISTLKNFVGNYYGKDDFKGIQYNSFYSEECNSLVLFFEDLFDRANYTDMDYNDMVFAITDNPEINVPIKSLRLPAYTLDENGQVIVTP